MMDPSVHSPRRGSNPPDFLVKLLSMVQSEDPALIAWHGGKVFIQDPSALEKKMSAYFRHSNFSSFQRQLNNFGFRKVEGKGKLAPCMYMHDDLQGMPPDSLLRIRRKAPATTASSPAAALTTGVGSSWQSTTTSTATATISAPQRFAGSDAKRRRTDLYGSSSIPPRLESDTLRDTINQPGVGEAATMTKGGVGIGCNNRVSRNVNQAPCPQNRSFDEIARELSRDVELLPRQERQFPPRDENSYSYNQHSQPSFISPKHCFQDTALEQDSLEPFPADRVPPHRDSAVARDAFESGLLLSFLENEPTPNLPPTSSSIPFFDPATEGSSSLDSIMSPAVHGGDDLSFDKSPLPSLRVNIFGKQHRVLQPNTSNGAANNGVH